MNFPHSSKSAGEIFNSIKDKISFQGRNNRSDEYYEDEFYDEPVDDFDNVMIDGSADYGAYGYDAAYDDAYGAGNVTSRGHYSASPDLVSSEAARASVSSLGSRSSRFNDADTLSFSTRPSRTRTTVQADVKNDVRSTRGREAIEGYDVPATSYSDFVSPYKKEQQQPSSASFDSAHVSASSLANKPQTGLDKLFMPTTSNASVPTGSAQESSLKQQTSVDPYQAYENNTAYSHVPSRDIVVIKPVTYEDVEGIANAVRSGAIVALVLRITSDALAKRVLDFSFGVASALDARVECVANKVFAVMKGSELTLDEKHELRKQGIN